MRDSELGKKIKELRLRSGISQDELSEISQLSLRTIQRIENGETEPRGDSLKRLSKAFNINVEELTTATSDELPRSKLKADKNLLLLLNFSAFGFLIFPLLGIIFPWIIYSVYKDKTSGVNEQGKQIMKFQISWCVSLFIVYLYIISLKFFDFLHLPAPQNEKVLFIIPVLYIFNTLVVLTQTLRCIEIKKIVQRLASS